MRILPYTLNQLYSYKKQINTQNLSQPQSFRGAQADFDKKLEEVNDVHCPLCGVKMISEDEFNKKVKESEKIVSAKDLDNFLQSNKEYLPNHLQRLCYVSKEIMKEKPDTDFNYLSYKLFADSISRNKKAIISGIKYLDKLQKENIFTENDSILVEECKMRMSELTHYSGPKFNYPEFQKILQETIAKIQNENKWQIYEKIKEPVKKTFWTTQIFRYTKEAFGGSRTTQLAKNILQQSLQHGVDIIKDSDSETDMNKILICGTCSSNKIPVYKQFVLCKDNKNFQQYENDIAKNILNGKLEGYEKYPFAIGGLIHALTKGTSEAPKSELMKALKIHLFEINQKELDFRPTAVKDMVCSSCGNPTITHEQKCKIYEQINKAQSFYQLKIILKKNLQHIGKKYLSIVKDFEFEIDSNPAITENELIKNLQKRAKKRIQDSILKNDKYINECFSKYNLNTKDKNLLNILRNEIYTNFYEFDESKKYPFDEYEYFLIKFLDNLETPYKNDIISELKETIRLKYIAHAILLPPVEAVRNTGSEIKVIVQNLIKSGVATTDHFIAKDKKGENTLRNLTVMCSSCNREKTNYNFKYWLKLHPEMKSNLQRYLNKVVYAINKGNLAGYENYPKEFSEFLYQITNGAINLNYCKKTN